MDFKVDIPKDIKIQIQDNAVYCEGPLGSLIIPRKKLDPKASIMFKMSNSHLHFRSPQANGAYQGSIEAIFKQSFQGLLQGYLVHLELVGVGFRVEKNDDQLEFKLGFSHPIFFQLPNDIRAVVSKPTEFSLYGVDSNRLTQIAANIKKLRVPEAYKGKGIRRSSDILHLKEMKKT